MSEIAVALAAGIMIRPNTIIEQIRVAFWNFNAKPDSANEFEVYF